MFTDGYTHQVWTRSDVHQQLLQRDSGVLQSLASLLFDVSVSNILLILTKRSWKGSRAAVHSADCDSVQKVCLLFLPEESPCSEALSIDFYSIKLKYSDILKYIERSQALRIINVLLSRWKVEASYFRVLGENILEPWWNKKGTCVINGALNPLGH